MGIYRVIKNSNYTTINNTGLKDERLTWKAKGILAYALTLPDDWRFHIKEIATHAKDGEDSLRSGFDELKKLGYVRRYPVKDEESKKILRWETEIYETPYQEKPHVENPEVEKPDLENPTLLNTKEQSTKELSTDINKYIVEIVNYLNDVCSKSYRDSTQKTRTLIKARLKEKFTVEDFKKVIDVKHAEWTGTSQEKYLRPETLFGTKFESYLQQWELWKNAKTRGHNARPHETGGGYAQEEARRRIKPADNRGFAKTIG
ncbi:conserved phage C-terminal domain-containing protein [Bacillus paranthracis]|uniref:replication initiation protein n=1 Tax=Bacillus phage phi4B1 TaxID=1643324 RepID=UPI000200F411|nr:conserved phage C-terminal domain-containing protein [Bacillus paranthracis]YP_009206343.1 replication initiation protein [Bacillus phage phi4B1]ADY20337.1 hypothetical protein YBT020_05455 [Bacillus thuringiensis serovar finitimus YBT-020]OTX71281.1 phage replication protein [Bacillus thuringiensis serovar finitimus]PGZ45722.1 phage replication protein [Bacillus anthracis]ALF02553.1 hypothetical protein XO26_0044 [Bacillus phage phi4B1]MCR6799384.1 conserved phage C-terminal domain-contai